MNLWYKEIKLFRYQTSLWMDSSLAQGMILMVYAITASSDFLYAHWPCLVWSHTTLLMLATSDRFFLEDVQSGFLLQWYVVRRDWSIYIWIKWLVHSFFSCCASVSVSWILCMMNKIQVTWDQWLSLSIGIPIATGWSMLAGALGLLVYGELRYASMFFLPFFIPLFIFSFATMQHVESAWFGLAGIGLLSIVLIPYFTSWMLSCSLQSNAI